MDISKIEPVLKESREKTAADPLHRESVNLYVLSNDGQTMHTLDTASISRPHAISGKVLDLQEQKARESGLNPDSGVIRVHVHPSVDGHKSFSLSDVYSLISSTDNKLRATLVTEAGINIAAFLTRDTRYLGLSQTDKTPYEEFAKKWFEDSGWEYRGFDSQGENAKKLDGALPIWEIVKNIAKEYRFALYKSNAYNHLKREIPS